MNGLQSDSGLTIKLEYNYNKERKVVVFIIIIIYHF